MGTPSASASASVSSVASGFSCGEQEQQVQLQKLLGLHGGSLPEMAPSTSRCLSSSLSDLFSPLREAKATPSLPAAEAGGAARQDAQVSSLNFSNAVSASSCGGGGLSGASPAIIACRKWQQTQGIEERSAAALVSFLRALGNKRHHSYRAVFADVLLPRLLQRVQRLAAELHKARRCSCEASSLQTRRASTAAAGVGGVVVMSGCSSAAASVTSTSTGAEATAGGDVCREGEDGGGGEKALLEKVLKQGVATLRPMFQLRPLQPALAALLAALLPEEPEPPVMNLLLSDTPAASDFLQVAALPTRQSVWIAQPWRFYDAVSPHIDRCVALLQRDCANAALQLVETEPFSPSREGHVADEAEAVGLSAEESHPQRQGGASETRASSASSLSSSSSCFLQKERQRALGRAALRELDFLLSLCSGNSAVYALLLAVVRLKYIHSLLPRGEFRLAVRQAAPSGVAAGADGACGRWGCGLGGHFIPIEKTDRDRQHAKPAGVQRRATSSQEEGDASAASSVSAAEEEGLCKYEKTGRSTTTEAAATPPSQAGVSPAAAGESSSSASCSILLAGGSAWSCPAEVAFASLRLLLAVRRGVLKAQRLTLPLKNLFTNSAIPGAAAVEATAAVAIGGGEAFEDADPQSALANFAFAFASSERSSSQRPSASHLLKTLLVPSLRACRDGREDSRGCRVKVRRGRCSALFAKRGFSLSGQEEVLSVSCVV